MLIGLMHQKPATIELPTAMEDLLTRATVSGEGLQMLLRRINEQQIVTGRTGLLLDLPENPDPAKPLPYIALYWAETIINWDEDTSANIDNLNLVVLNESGSVRTNDFEWKREEKYRVLLLGDPLANESKDDPKAIYNMGVFEKGNTPSATSMESPMLRGKTLDKIPFVFINSKDNVPATDNPPLLGLARLALTIYRGEADYRQCLYMQGQETLVVVGGSKESETRVGAGAKIDVDVNGDAKYIGVSSSGLTEQRMSLENDRKQADTKSGQLVSPGKTIQESGEALKTRLAAQTATLNQIALSGAAGLEYILKIAAEWMGQDPEKVVVTPNTEFADFDLAAEELVKLLTARGLGAPLSLESIHTIMQDRGMTTMQFEDEIEKILDEDAAMLPTGTDAGGEADDDAGDAE